MDRFLSSAVNKVDAKGRVSVPAHFRAVVQKRGYSELYGLRCLDRPAMDVGLCVLRRQPAAQLAELRRRRARPPCAGICSSVLECRPNACVRPLHGERKVAGALLGVGDELGETAVQRAALVDRCRPVDARGEERMREPDAILDELDDLRLEGGRHRGRRVPAQGGAHELEGRLGQR